MVHQCGGSGEDELKARTRNSVCVHVAGICRGWSAVGGGRLPGREGRSPTSGGQAAALVLPFGAPRRAPEGERGGELVCGCRNRQGGARGECLGESGPFGGDRG